MAASTFFIPSVNVIGADSLTDAMNMMADYGFTRTLIVTDNMLTKLGMAGDVQKALEERNIFSVIYDGTQPNPTTENVAAGLKLLKENNCDSVILHTTAQKVLRWWQPMAAIFAITKALTALQNRSCR